MTDKNPRFEHKPHVGSSYSSSNDGRRVLIVGHSHHRDDTKPDYADFTLDCVDWARAGKMQDFPFFARQPKYLNLDRESYYDRIALINFVPDALPGRYDKPSETQLEHGRDRLFSIIADHKPTHIFVVSSRLDFGKQLPFTDEQRRGEALHTITANGDEFHWGTYTVGDTLALVCRLPHPQAAKTATMQEAFKQMMARSA